MSSCFRIVLPDGYKFSIFYNKDDNKIELLNQLFLLKWHEYIIDHWIFFQKHDLYKLNYEDKTKYFLDRVGTFLMLNSAPTDIISDTVLSKIYKHEIPVSCASTISQDILYSIDSDSSNKSPTSSGENLMTTNLILSGKINNAEYISMRKKKAKALSKYRHSKTYKMNKIFCSDEFHKKEIVVLSNNDVYSKFYDDLSHIQSKFGLNDQDFKKWLKKPFRNLYKHNVYEYKSKKFSEHKGLIDKSKPYKWKWCYVDSENFFKFDGNTYKINSEVTQYKVTSDNSSTMDNILVYEQYNNQFFFDMNIDRINNFQITKFD